ncbi:hypothetical protein [Lelliottia wanjuensis]|nr:hypothetical protein [Lelliottia sp. V104_15]MDK9603482.1 hypothetical protein [Lelliottia sp. V104_15]
MVIHKLTGKDVMHYQKTPLADRIVLWASAIISLIFIFVTLFS